MTLLTEPTRIVLAKGFTWNETVWNPSMISTALWLDAADASTISQSSGAVSQWNDKSGNSRHATATSTERPTYSATSFNSKQGLTFNGTSNVMQANALAPVLDDNDTPFSAYVAVNFSTGSVLALGSTANSNPLHRIIAIDSPPSGISIRRDTGLTIASVTGSSFASANHLLGVVFTGTSATLYKNGTQDATGSLNVGTLDTLDRFAIGAQVRSTTASYMTGTVSEIIINSTAISTDTRQRVEGYLAHKWGLTANLPSDHPYKTVGPTP